MTTKSIPILYLDTNVLSRPFDDQTQPTIQEETSAFLTIVPEIQAGKLVLLCSDILEFEVYNILDAEKCTQVADYLALCSGRIGSSDEILDLGRKLESQCHIRARDALHVASAIVGGARYFLSCDKKVVQMKQARCYRQLVRLHHKGYFSAMSPVLFAKRLKMGEVR